MSTLATEAFTGTANPIGAPWVTLTGESDFQKNGTGTPSNLASDCCARNTSVTWPNDQWAQATVSVTGGVDSDNKGPGVALRCASAARTYYRIITNKAATGNISVTKRIAGVGTTLANITAAWTDGDVLYAEVRTNTLKVFRNGAQIGSDIAGDSAIAAGDAGIIYSSTLTAAALDDWSAGDFPGVDPAQRPTRVAVQARIGG